MDVDIPDGAIESIASTIPKPQILSDIHKSKESDLPWYINYYDLVFYFVRIYCIIIFQRGFFTIIMLLGKFLNTPII